MFASVVADVLVAVVVVLVVVDTLLPLLVADGESPVACRMSARALLLLTLLLSGLKSTTMTLP